MAAASAPPVLDAPPLSFPIAGLSATSTQADILRAVPDLLSFNRHKRLFTTDDDTTTTDTSTTAETSTTIQTKKKSIWKKLYRCIKQFGCARKYGVGNLATVYLHYRRRTLFDLTGECAPHPDERADLSKEKKKQGSRLKRQRLKLEQEAVRRAIFSSQPASTQPAIDIDDSVADAMSQQPAVHDSMLDWAPQQPAADSLADAASPQPAIGIAASISDATSPQPAVINSLSDLPRYHDAHPETQTLSSLFTLYKQKCGLQHGADVGASNLPETRSRKLPSPSGVATLPEPDLSIPSTVAPGYAECTLKSFDTVCQWLCESAPLALRMGTDSVFLDIGSGYGKCVVQARLRGDVRKSIGIEFVPERYNKSVEMQVVHIPAQFKSLRTRLHGHMELLQGDATDVAFAPQFEQATHIFMFDWVFSDDGTEAVMQCIEQASNLRLLVCCQRPRRMQPHFRKLYQMQLSTGKQHPTVYFYARCPSLPSASAEME
jgi:hypothetical protein